MVFRQLVVAAASVLTLACNSGLPARAPRPSLLEAAVFRPEFVTETESWFAGTGFFATHNNRTWCLWAHHLYDSEVPVSRHEVRAWGVIAPEVDIGCRPLVVDGAKTSGSGNDFAVGLPESAPARSLEISCRAPAEGDHVWMLAEPADSSELAFEAVVTSVDGGELWYDFYDKFMLQATSGAPIVDSDGRAVAINLGGGRWFGRTYGYATIISEFDRFVGRINTP